MKSELIMNSNVLDILFENKNKAYGAYDLRKYYDQRLYKSLGVMLGVVTLLTLYSFIPGKKVAPPLHAKTFDMGGPVMTPEKPKEKPKEQIPVKQRVQQIIPSSFKITNDKDPVDTIAAYRPDVAIGLTNIPDSLGGTGDPGPGDPDGKTGDNDTSVAAVPEPPFNPEAIVESPDSPPTYPDGLDGLKKFLQKHLVNPREMEEGELVKVVVRFVVGYDGKLKSFDVVQDGGEEFNKEVIRVLKKMPDWKPGKSKGRNVSVYYSIPIKFVPGEF